MSAGEIVSSLIQFVVVVGVTFVLLCLVTSYLRFQRMTDRAGATDLEDVDGATAFQIQIARRLGSAHRDPEPFVVLLVRLAEDAPDLDTSLVAITGLVQHGLRTRDTLLQIDDHSLGLVVGGTRQVGLEVAERILEPFSASPDSDIRISIASFPENGARGEDLLAAAHQAFKTEPDPPIRAAGDVDSAPAVRPVATPENPLAAIPAAQHRLLDPMTGALLESHLGGVLHKRIAQCRKDRLPASVMIVQIDHLDRYVDHYGPGGIDTIFRHLGSYLQGAVREDDLLARYQDDQVVIIMTADPAGALAAAHRIAEGIRQLEIEQAGTRLKITTSIGVAGYPDHGASSRKLLAHAVTALEAAKAKGRNRCLGYEPGMQVSPRVEQDLTSF